MKSALLFTWSILLVSTLSVSAQEPPQEGEKNPNPPSLILPPVDQVDPEFRPFLSDSLSTSPRADLRRPGIFSELTFAWLFPNLSGHRIAPRDAVLINPARFPNVDAASSHLGLSFRATIGYRFPSLLGEVKLTGRTLFGSRELIFKNHDPHGLSILRQRYPTANPSTMDEEDTNEEAIDLVIQLLTFGLAKNNTLPEVEGIHDPIGAMVVRSGFSWFNADLIYGSLPIQAGSRWNLQLEAGGRVGVFFSDDVGEGWFFKQRVSNSFTGYGPVGAINVHYLLDPHISETATRTSLYFRGEGGVLLGQSRQTLTEELHSPDGIFYHQQRQTKSQTVETIGAEFGILRRAGENSRSQFRFGYQFDQFWNLNRLNNSRLNLTAHGIFLRWELRF
jgi:hypothetical protein